MSLIPSLSLEKNRVREFICTQDAVGTLLLSPDTQISVEWAGEQEQKLLESRQKLANWRKKGGQTPLDLCGLAEEFRLSPE